MNYVTIDDYYDIEFYNECRNALLTNNTPVIEYINVKPPYSWYLELDNLPVLVNYDRLSRSMEKYIVNKVEPATSNEEYLLQRRDSNSGKKSLDIYVKNAPLREADNSDFACFFNARNKDQLLELSKTLGKIYYFGRYYNKFKVAMCTNKMIKNFIDPDDILVEKSSGAIQMELDLNWKVFKLNDRLRKFTETPLFVDGKYKPVKISKFTFNL
jgi:hypothetical protein